MNEKKFVDGLIVKAPHPNAPDFVKCSISIKRKDLGNWLRGETDEWINLDVKESKGGKLYAEVNTYKKDQDSGSSAGGVPSGFDDDQDIPFK